MVDVFMTLDAYRRVRTLFLPLSRCSRNPTVGKERRPQAMASKKTNSAQNSSIIESDLD